MAIVGTEVLTLSDWAKRIDPDGNVSAVAELLSQTNEILDDMLFIEGNLPTGHRSVIRTGLPSVYWRMLNQGVPPSKSTTAQADDGSGMLEAYSEVDKDLASLNGNVEAFRMSEANAFIESMNQEFAQTLFYGNSSTAPSEFTGLAPRYSSLAAQSGQNVLNAGGVGTDNTSIWLVCWGTSSVFGHFPKGSKAGLFHEDLGLQTSETANGVIGAKMRTYLDHFQWKAGVTVKDWRYVARTANIDVSNLVGKTSAADLVEFMIKMTHRVPNLKMGKPVFYMNRSVFQMLDIQRRDDVGVGGGVSYDNVDGMVMPSFRGIPIRVTDAILDTEQAVA